MCEKDENKHLYYRNAMLLCMWSVYCSIFTI